jgi:CubicO group peptidase (beta-lactamase class C family)
MNQEIVKKATQLQPRIQALLDGLIDDGYELGAQVAIYLGGELVADVNAGRVNSIEDRRVETDTVFPVCSTGKGIVSTLAHMLAEEGRLDYGKPVAYYWPEFAVNGKESITVLQALSHQAGLPQVPLFASLEEALDFDAACDRFAQLSPEWEPGSQMQYHSRTFSWLAGGLVRRAAGVPLPQLLRDYITVPLGIEREMFFGIDDDGDKRFSPFEAQPATQAQNTTDASTYAPPPPGSLGELSLGFVEFFKLPHMRRTCMPAVNGIMSARAIAKHYAALMGEVDGVRLIPESRLDKALTRVTRPGGTPECFGHGFGLGYALKGPASDMGACFGHGGAGGSEGMANRHLGLALGVTKNRMDTHQDAPEHTNRLVVQEIHKILGHDGDGGFFGPTK